MKHLLVLPFLAFPAFALAQSAEPAATPESAMRAAVICAHDHLAEYDDKISPANVVARTVASACRTELSILAAVTNPESRGKATLLLDELMKGEEFVSLVLQHRTGHLQ
jgi:hypothetical protein